MVPPSASSKRPSRRSAAERPLLVTEQLALEQRLRDRGAVHRDERLGAAQRQIVDRARHQLLAGARFPFHQHGGAHGRHLLDLDQHFLDGGGLADDAGALLQLAALDQAAHGRGYFRRVGRLGEIAGQAEPPGESLGIRLGVLHQAERGDRAVARQTEQLDGTRLVQPACHDDAVGRGLAPYGLPRLVERVRQGGVEPRRLERRVDADGVLQIVRGDEDAVRHRLRCAVRRARLLPRSPGRRRGRASPRARPAHPSHPPSSRGG